MRSPEAADPSRRDFLKTSLTTAGMLGASLPLLAKEEKRFEPSQSEMNCILLFLVGGPSQLDTWDPKPNAPSEVRGPFRAIPTRVPGMQLSECFPKMAQQAERFSILRSVHHTAAPIHETGHQLMQTGFLCRDEMEYPHLGAMMSKQYGPRDAKAPAFAVLPGPIQHTGVSLSHGQGAGFLGDAHEPRYLGSESGSFMQNVRHARELIEQGTRFVTVNMYDSLFGKITWDCHADRGSLPTTLEDYRHRVCPDFDLAYTQLLEELSQRGMLDTTLVVAMGEFGRTPFLNLRGGRDHWPGAYSVLFAGGGVRGGQVIGSTDALGGEPKDNPITPTQIVASIYRILNLEIATDPRFDALRDASPISELV